MRERTEPFERAWRAARGEPLGWERALGSGEPLLGQLDSEQLAGVLKLRRDVWINLRKPKLLRAGERLVALAAVMYLFSFFYRLIALPTTLLVLGIICAIIGSLSHRHRVPLRRDFEEKLCPDCGYDVSASGDAIDLAVPVGEGVGPARCPECGSPWPRVPAPLPVMR